MASDGTTGFPSNRDDRLLTRPALLLLGAVAGLVALQLVAISLLYGHAFEFECRAMAPAFFCAGLSGAVIRAIAMTGVAAVFVLARPAALAEIGSGLRHRPAWAWIAVQVVGFLLILLPWSFLTDAATPGVFLTAALLWLVGAIAATLGTALALAPASTWVAAAKRAGAALPLVLLVAALAPEIAASFQVLWKWEPVTAATFSSVQLVLETIGYEVVSLPEEKWLGIDAFVVAVGPQCSGVEGFLLIGSFLSFYIWLFRSELRFPHVWLLLPIGIVCSWLFNVLRIAVLILIGHHVSPDLAVNGFHSHAGWLMFTILAVSLAMIAHAMPWLRAERTRAPVATSTSGGPVEAEALIVPFIIFMASALIASTFSETPGLYYPLRFVAMAAGLAVALPLLRKLDWVVDPLSLGTGLLIGLAWIVTSPASDPASPLALALEALPVWLFAIWVVARVLGTVLLVPLIEELFFRGYILRRIDTSGLAMRVLAIVVSSALFAALHDRWILAAIAGVVFGLLMLRSGRLSDAILSHAAANGLIAAWAVYSQDWAVI